jgi:hypothetical protein
MKAKGLSLPHAPPNMNLRVKMIFDEDLKTLIVPRIKVLVFRVSKDTPFEVAAKAIATKNGHKELWKRYSFSILKKSLAFNDTVDDCGDTVPQFGEDEHITDMRKCFSSYMRDDSYEAPGTEHELVFFYKISGEYESPFVINNSAGETGASQSIPPKNGNETSPNQKQVSFGESICQQGALPFGSVSHQPIAGSTSFIDERSTLSEQNKEPSENVMPLS